MFPASDVSAPLGMRIATGGMCSKESGIESNRTFIRTCPYCLAVIPQAQVEPSGEANGRNCTAACCRFAAPPFCKFCLLALFRHSRTGQHSHHNPRSLPGGVIHALSSFHKVSGLGVRDIYEGLRIAVGEREPRALDLHHDAVAATERVVDVLHGEVDLFHLAGREGLGPFETVAKLSAERLAPHQLLIATHGEWGWRQLGPGLAFVLGPGLVQFAVGVVGGYTSI